MTSVVRSVSPPPFDVEDPAVSSQYRGRTWRSYVWPCVAITTIFTTILGIGMGWNATGTDRVGEKTVSYVLLIGSAFSCCCMGAKFSAGHYNGN